MGEEGMLRGERTERRKARKLERDEKESAAQNKPRRGVFFLSFFPSFFLSLLFIRTLCFLVQLAT